MLESLAPTRKYFFTMFVVSSVLLVIFTATIYNQARITEKRNQAVTHSYEVLHKIREVYISGLNVETGQRGYLLSGQTDFLAPYNQAVTLLSTDLAELEAATISDVELQAEIVMLKEASAAYQAIVVKQLSQFRRSGTRYLTLEDMVATKAAMDKVRGHIDNLMQSATALLDQRTSSALNQESKYRITLFFGTCLGLSALIVANLVVYLMLQRNRQSEEKLRAAEERMRRVMDGVNDGIFDYDLETGHIYLSPSHKAMLGYSEDTLPVTLDAFTALIHPDDVDAALATMRAYTEGDTQHYLTEFRVQHLNGSWRWVLSRGVGIRDWRGIIYRLVGAHTDITAQKTRESDLEQLNAELEGFTYIASHDLRAPLVNLKGFAAEVEHTLLDIRPLIEQLKTHLNAEDAQRLEASLQQDIPESLGFISAAVERMDKLTSAIVDMSRIGRREYRTEAVECDTLVQRCLDALGHEINSKNITVDVDALPVVYTDPLALEQIFGNLLDNAVKYLSPDRPGYIHVGVRQSGYDIRFSVADNGRGIAESDRRKVFEIFRRAGNSGDVRGSGMGMAYVNATLRKLGGRIWLESTLDKGSTFYFTLPVKNEEEGLAA